MTEKYFQELNLPEIPVLNVEDWLMDKLKDVGYSLHTEPEKVLNDQIINKFRDIGVTPGYITIFTNSNDGVLDNRFTHSDVTSVQDPRTLTGPPYQVKWKTCHFGINFEIYDNENIFNWYKNKDESKFLMPPIIIKTLGQAWLSGIHYGEKRGVGGIPEQLEHVATTSIRGKPTLVRTDVPHNTLYKVPPGISHRVGISIRFYENWTWEEALEKFKPLYIK